MRKCAAKAQILSKCRIRHSSQSAYFDAVALRLMYANRGLHGHQGSSELRLRGWALLLNFRPYAPRSNQPRTHDSPAHRLNGKRYHEHWLHNLMASTSLMGFRNRQPTIR